MAKERKSTLKFSEVIKRIENGKIAPVYFITGDQDYLLIELLSALRTALFSQNPRNANVERVSARPGKASDLMNTALEYSLFGGGKMIIVYDAHKYNEKDKKLLLDFLSQLPADNHLVLLHPGKMDMRTKYFKHVTSKTEWLSLLPLDQRSAKFWIQRQLKKYNLRIDAAAADLFVDFAGYSYSTISEEVDKLSLNVEPGSLISVEDVRKYGSKSAVFSIFELTDALGHKNREKALNRLGRLLESGEKFVGILGAIARHFNYLVMIDSLRDLRSDNMVSAKIGVKPFFVNKCREQIAGFDDDGLKNALRDIFEAEYQNRFEDMSDTYILENLVIKITAAQE